MATKAIYITVRLDLENSKADTISDEEAQEFISELDYEFTAPESCDISIFDTEICGMNE